MCLIALKPKDSLLSEKHLDVIAEQSLFNGDGFGVAISDGKQLYLRKFPKGSSIKRLLKTIRCANDTKHSILIHLRYATAGTLGTDNIHPFPIGKDCVLAHNGHIDGVYDHKRSDSRILAEWLHDAFHTDTAQVKSPNVQSLLLSIVGTDRVAFLWKDHSYLIINESIGEWSDGIWFSRRVVNPLLDWTILQWSHLPGFEKWRE